MKISWNFNIHRIGYIKIDVNLKREYRVVIGIVGKKRKTTNKIYLKPLTYMDIQSVNIHLLQQAICRPDQEIHINHIVYSKFIYNYSYLTNCFK